MKPQKPMLASNVTDFSKLKFPAYVSPKLDGIRCTCWGGVLYSRSLKPIPNVNVQAKFGSFLQDGDDGELIVGEPNENPYRRTVSVVMSDDKPADDVRFYQFDRVEAKPFHVRFEKYSADTTTIDHRIVPQIGVGDLASLEHAEEAFLDNGYEGLMYRDPNGRYKHGRSSEKEALLLKVKRFKDAEATVTEAYEEMGNNNEAFTNELGRTARSSAKAGKTGNDTLGGFHTVGVGGTYDGIEFDVAVSSLEHVQRHNLWMIRETLKDKLLVYKYFPTGGDSRPRHPIFKGWRDARDL